MEKKMKKFLVTGGAGFIGSHLCEKLLKQGHSVVCLDNFYNGNLNNIRGLFNHEKFHFVEGDILDFELLKEVTEGCDYIMHLAGQIHVEKSIIRPDETMRINLQGTRNLLEICRQKKSIGMTFASSAEVYGEKDGTHSEQSPLNPQSPYAASKVAAEALCVSYYHTYKTNVRVIRNFNTFGPRQRSYGYGSVIAIFARRALDNKSLIIYGDGEQTRDYQYIEDAVDGYISSLRMPPGEVFNTGYGKDHSILKIAEMIIEITKSSSKIVHAEPRPGEVRYLNCDIEKAKSFGHTPRFSLKQGLEKYISWLVQYEPDGLEEMK